MVATGIYLEVIHWLEEFLKNRTFPAKLGPPLERRYPKIGVAHGYGLGPLLFLIFINDLEYELTSNHVFFAEDAKVIAPRNQQHELRSSIQQELSCYRKWDLPLNASKSHHLSIGGHSDHRLVLSEKAKCEKANDLGISVNKAGECCTS